MPINGFIKQNQMSKKHERKKQKKNKGRGLAILKTILCLRDRKTVTLLSLMAFLSVSNLESMPK